MVTLTGVSPALDMEGDIEVSAPTRLPTNVNKTKNER